MSNKMEQEYKILTVQRVSDGEVFSVGDTIKTVYNTTAIQIITIEDIRIDPTYGGNIVLSNSRIHTALSIAKHVKQ